MSLFGQFLLVGFCFSVIWHRRYMIIFGETRSGTHNPWSLVLCWRPAESDVTITPLVMHMDWLRKWYNHAAHPVSSSTALTFLTSVSEKHKSISPSAIQVKNQQRQ